MVLDPDDSQVLIARRHFQILVAVAEIPKLSWKNDAGGADSRLPCGLRCGLSRNRQSWRWAESCDSCSYAALSIQEAFPQPIRRRDAEGGVGDAHGLSRVAQADDEREERP